MSRSERIDTWISELKEQASWWSNQAPVIDADGKYNNYCIGIAARKKHMLEIMRSITLTDEQLNALIHCYEEDR